MNNDKNKQQSASFSLQNEIKKRRTQEIQRAIENKQIEKARGDDPRRASQTTPSVPAPDPRRASQQIPAVDPRRASQTTAAVDPRRASQQIQSLDPRRASQTSNAVEPRRASQQMQAVDPRRASQQMQTADPRRASQQMAAADPRRASQTMKAADPRRTSQTMNAVDTRRASQTLTVAPISQLRKRRTTMIASVAVLSVVAVIMLTMLLISNQNMATARPIPTIGAKTSDQVMAYLKQVGVPVTNQRVFDKIDFKNWTAKELREVTVQAGDKKLTFLLLGYSDPRYAIGDSMRAASGSIPSVKGWKAIPMGNMLWVIQPNSDPTLRHDVESHLTTFILAGYHTFLRTATPTDTPVGQAATATPTP